MFYMQYSYNKLNMYYVIMYHFLVNAIIKS